MKLLMILAVVVSCKAQVIIPYMGPMHQRIEDPSGSKGFMYTDWNQNRQEMWMGDGNVVGQYSYIDANGKPVVTYYTAGRQGFQVSSNNLPVAPLSENLSPAFQAPQPVKDTPEVAEAKRVMAELHEKASRRTKRQAVAPQWMYPVNTPTFPLTSYNPYFSPLMTPIHVLPGTSWITNQPAIKAETKSRQRREADPWWPTMYSVAPGVVRTKQLTPVEGRTPADTTQLKMTTVEHQLPVAAMPTFGWQNGRPITYSLMKPAFMPMNI